MDLVITGATVVDGTGAPARTADVGVDGDTITAIAEPGTLDTTGAEVIDGTGLVLAPGFVDPHTHYDAQIFWDPGASPSDIHGVTSMIAGNCGFTLAPVHAEDHDYLTRLLAKVEGMAIEALVEGVPWNWESFGDYLDRLDGKVGANIGFLVGHCAVRRYVMGEESVGNEATPEQLAAMRDLLARSIDEGGLGFSTSLSFTHSDGDGNPVPSRFATHDEVLELCDVVSEKNGTTLEVIVDGCLNGFDDDEVEFLTQMSLRGDRPVNWNVLTVDSRQPDRHEHQLEAMRAARARGARVVPLTMPILVGMNMSFGTYCALNLIPGWKAVLGLPIPERMDKLRDPVVRALMLAAAASPDVGVVGRLTDWHTYVIGDTFSAENDGLKGRRVDEIAAERGTTPFDTLLDVVLADDLRTVLWPTAPENDDESWAMRAEIWRSGEAMLGGSDAGAHLDRMMGTCYPTQFLGDCLRGRKLVSLEEAVKLLTDDPARLFGLRDRGRVAEGWKADLVLFDPATIDAGDITLQRDLPGGAPRLWSASTGVVGVWVNGTRTVTDGAPTGALAGTVLRSGRDTETVSVSS
jgi:N-acyl-D-aspartate/D-glutamate deacylase